MIFATVGTHGQPFSRLLDAAMALPGEVIVQYGHNRRPPGCPLCVAFMDFPDMIAHMERAEAVVTHAGVGSILSARRAGHVPVVVPRLARLGEHVDDHQSELTRSLEEHGHVIAVWEIERLPEAVASVPPRGPAASPGDGALARAVRLSLLGERQVLGG